MALRNGREWTARHGLAVAGGLASLALLYILKGGPTPGQIAAGNLFTSKGVAVTTTRASNKTCTKGAAYFDVAQMLANPENLATSDWAKTGAAATANYGSAPNGTTTSSRLVAPTPGSRFTALVLQTVVASRAPGGSWANQTVTLSGYVRSTSGSAQSVALQITYTGFADYYGPDLAVTGTWQRFTFTQNVGTGGANVYAGIAPASTLAAYDVEVWGLKLELGSTATTYVPGNNQIVTYLGNNAPCVESAGLLVEGASTNLTLQSAALNSVPWTVSGTTVVADQAIAPDGTLSADLVSFAGSSNYILSNSTTSGAGPYGVSFYARSVSGTQSSVRFALRGSSGATVVAQTTPTLTTAWQRVVVTGTPGAGDSIVAFIDSTSGAQTVYVWGVQLEALPFASSYIPTTGTTAARAAESNTVPNPLKTADTVNCLSATIAPYQWAPTGAERAVLSVGGGSGAPNTVSMFFQSGNTLAMNVLDSTPSLLFLNTAPPSSGTHRLTMCRTGATTATYALDGISTSATVGGSAGGTLTQPSLLYLGSYGGGANPLWGYISDICVAAKPGVCK